jgi:hypothetical protein
MRIIQQENWRRNARRNFDVFNGFTYADSAMRSTFNANENLIISGI